MFHWLLLAAWFVLSNFAAIFYLALLAVFVVLSIYLFPAMFQSRLPENLPADAPEPSEEEFNAPE